MRVTLAKGDMILELDPCAGGSVSALKHRDLDVLRPAPPRCGPAFDARRYSAFPMVPFVGRIHNARFKPRGDCIQLPANLPPEPHAIHGHGWQDVWKVDAVSETEATMVYHHMAAAWPWTYEARQVFQLSNDNLSLTLTVTNKSDTPMPVGIGWHPYFTRKGARLSVATTHAWSADEETGVNNRINVPPACDLSVAAEVSEMRLDRAFSVRPDPIRITWSTHSVTMTKDPVFAHATIYVPHEQDYFCVEPISHAPNAINSDLPASMTGYRELAPGETLSGTITLHVEH